MHYLFILCFPVPSYDATNPLLRSVRNGDSLYKALYLCAKILANCISYADVQNYALYTRLSGLAGIALYGYISHMLEGKTGLSVYFHRVLLTGRKVYNNGVVRQRSFPHNTSFVDLPQWQKGLNESACSVPQ